ncbi:MAG TPA: TetR/AcrR family transcriptional regulator C-terminal domain-containing protein [Candidatus Limiplasma pullistercoris]|nr:TetR/AcrR family transcriptional regulator C-terminal domain-containing protein [Candidatus Limiplasma pullistercoris]
MPGDRDHRVRVTQRLTREAFTGLLKQKPIQSISIKELCEVAGINRGTFYAHYRDIYDLREKIESDMYRDVSNELKPLLDGGANPTQREITTAVFQWMRENRDMCEVVLGEYGDRTFLWKMLDLGRMVCQESYQRMFEGASSREISWFYAYASWGCIGLLRRWLWEDMETPASEVAGIAEQLIGQGMQFLSEKQTRAPRP